MVDSLMPGVNEKNIVGQPANSIMASAMPKASLLWRFLYFFAFLALFAAIVCYVFFVWQSKVYQQRRENEKQAISKLDTDISSAKNNTDYMKYAGAKVVYDLNKDKQGRGDRLSRIISVFEDLQKIGGDAVSFSDFSLDFSSLHLKGTVSDLKVMYGSGGVVDKFNALDFIKNITITDYKKTEYGYAFSLVAQILLDNVKH